MSLRERLYHAQEDPPPRPPDEAAGNGDGDGNGDGAVNGAVDAGDVVGGDVHVNGATTVNGDSSTDGGGNGTPAAPERAAEPPRFEGRSAESALKERLRESAAAPVPPTTTLRAQQRQQQAAQHASENPNVDPFAALKTRIHRACIDQLGAQLFGAAVDDDLTEMVHRAVEKELTADRTPLTREEHGRLIREITDDILGYGPLEPLLVDDSVTEVMVNGFDRIYIERAGKIESAQAQFLDNAHLLRIIDKIVSQVGRRIDEASPMVDARLPDGSRVNAIIPPLSLRGPTLTIRKFSRDPYTMQDLIQFGTLTTKSADFLAACVRGKLNILISGGTGTGKTTMLNAVSSFIPNEERIVTIEDAAELQLQQEHVVTLESRPPNIEGQGEIRIRELVRNALRMRPDRIIVGEVRSAETIDMLQAMNTGHEGSLTTIHANSPRDALARLETLVLTAGVDLPLRAIREQISSAFDLIIHLVRLVDGTRRITHVTEVLRMESDVITLQDIFQARRPDGESFGQSVSLLGPLEFSGLKPHFLDKLAANDVHLTADFFALDESELIRATTRRLRVHQP
jgi:pilus assembly protein CpaF